jgi:hypothetical protein
MNSKKFIEVPAAATEVEKNFRSESFRSCQIKARISFKCIR